MANEETDNLEQLKQEIWAMMQEYRSEREKFRERTIQGSCPEPECGRPFTFLFRNDGELKKPSCDHADLIMGAFDDVMGNPDQYPL